VNQLRHRRPSLKVISASGKRAEATTTWFRFFTLQEFAPTFVRLTHRHDAHQEKCANRGGNDPTCDSRSIRHFGILSIVTLGRLAARPGSDSKMGTTPSPKMAAAQSL
jgi:hypothetical protein